MIAVQHATRRLSPIIRMTFRMTTRASGLPTSCREVPPIPPVRERTKKAQEREALDAVYGSRISSDVREHERPDFLLTLRDGRPPFGVEIVDFYDSEVEARLQRIPDYVGTLLDGGGFRHKRDGQEIKLERISITTQTGEVTAANIPAIMREVPPLDACAAKVSAIIRVKDAKFEESSPRYRHVNLIVVDQTNLLGHLPVSSFYRSYCTRELRDAVYASRFREVFFLTSFKSGRRFVPLKLLVTLARLYLFHATCRAVPGLRFKDVHRFTRRFAEYLAGLAAGPVAFRHEGRESEVLYGDSGFLVSKELGVTVRLYNDAGWPESALELPHTTMVAPLLLGALAKCERNHTFTTEIAFPAGGSKLPKTVQPTSRAKREAMSRKASHVARG